MRRSKKQKEEEESNYVRYLKYKSSGFQLGPTDKTILWVPCAEVEKVALAPSRKKKYSLSSFIRSHLCLSFHLDVIGVHHGRDDQGIRYRIHIPHL